MNEDFLISRLEALCLRYGKTASEGRYDVAKRAGLSEQYLYQIITNKPMANGERRSIGKVAREKITKAFPDWLAGTPTAPTLPVAEPAAQYNVTPHHNRQLVQTVHELAEQINDDGLHELIGFARCLTGTHPAVKKNAA